MLDRHQRPELADQREKHRAEEKRNHYPFGRSWQRLYGPDSNERRREALWTSASEFKKGWFGLGFKGD